MVISQDKIIMATDTPGGNRARRFREEAELGRFAPESTRLLFLTVCTIEFFYFEAHLRCPVQVPLERIESSPACHAGLSLPEASFWHRWIRMNQPD